MKKDLHMHPYKVSVLQQLHPEDFQSRINYCQWFNAHINNDDILDKTFFTDEALTPADFFFFGHLKNTIYKNRMHNLEELQEAITTAIRNISENTLINVFENLKRRMNLCIENNGLHFEHLL